MNVKVEEDDPLAVPIPAVKAEPGVSSCVKTYFTFVCKTVFAFWTMFVCLHMKQLLSGEFFLSFPK
jgi:hypothetical protein